MAAPDAHAPAAHHRLADAVGADRTSTSAAASAAAASTAACGGGGGGGGSGGLLMPGNRLRSVYDSVLIRNAGDALLDSNLESSSNFFACGGERGGEERSIRSAPPAATGSLTSTYVGAASHVGEHEGGLWALDAEGPRMPPPAPPRGSCTGRDIPASLIAEFLAAGDALCPLPPPLEHGDARDDDALDVGSGASPGTGTVATAPDDDGASYRSSWGCDAARARGAANLIDWSSDDDNV